MRHYIRNLFWLHVELCGFHKAFFVEGLLTFVARVVAFLCGSYMSQVNLCTREGIAGDAMAAPRYQGIGRRIARCRVLLGWSQRELATRAGIDHATISRMERGWPSNFDFYDRVARACGLSRDLLTMEDDAVAARGIERWYHTRSQCHRLFIAPLPPAHHLVYVASPRLPWDNGAIACHDIFGDEF
jgi:DNA-binding XRE family transcriptional regulator